MSSDGPTRRSTRAHYLPKDEAEPEASGRPALIVALGASSGGLEALRTFFSAGPPAGVAYVVIQHMAPNANSMLVELLSSRTSLLVEPITDGMRVRAGHVHVLPPGNCLAYEAGRLRLVPTREHGAQPIDAFLHSLAEGAGDRAIAVILSGTASDGALGVKSIKERGGIVLAQEPATAQEAGMPESAIRTGLVDAVLPPGLLPEIVSRYGYGLDGSPDDLAADQLQEILGLVFTTTRHDFRHYKRAMLQRRIRRRMRLRGCLDVDAFLQVLRTEPAELALLHRDLLIGVTRFFRDPYAFDALAEQVLKPLVQCSRPDLPLRAWVPACSTGEEAYSLAILFSEAASALGRPVAFKIFASDLDAEALAIARQGLFPASIQAEVSPERLRRHFIDLGEAYQIRPELREAIVFAEHDVLRDPPFSRLDLVSCRNLLIYLEPALQRRAISLFHFALRPDGALFLGAADSLAGRDDVFTPLVKKWRIYARSGRALFADRPLLNFEPGAGRMPHADAPRTGSGGDLVTLVQRELLAKHTPPALLVDRRLEVLYFHGPVERYLSFPAGRTNYDLLAMCPAEVRPRLRRAMASLGEDASDAQVSLSWSARGQSRRGACLTIRPLRRAGGQDLFLVLLADHSPVQLSGAPGEAAASGSLEQLERELELLREELRVTTGDMELANDELRTSNEEVLSMNEELQATNEELETTKEELQALNEELTTVNQELQEKLRELEEANNDLVNFLASTETATLFLDVNLCIRRFTPAMRTFLALRVSDVGRPLVELARRIEDPSLIPDARLVLDELITREREIEAAEDTWYLRRVIPYRKRDERIDGVVVTYTDITHLKASQAARTEVELRRHLAEVERQACELAEANRRLQELDRLKADFLNAASHELRTPLTSILGFAEFLEDELAGALTPGQRGYVGQIQHGARRLERLVNDMLDFARFEAGRFELVPREVDMTTVIEAVAVSLRPQLEEARLSLHLDLPDVDATVVADPARVEQVLLNLVGNAIKFTPEGGNVTIRLARMANHLRLEVADDGIGMLAENLPRVFEKFYQAETGTTRAHGGAGLGLTISKALIEAHGGAIGAESKPGAGATFWFTLPLVPPATAASDS